MTTCQGNQDCALRLIVGFLSALTFDAMPAEARRPGIGLVQPTMYASASGVYRLRVEPADRWGHTSAKYRLTKDDVELWSGEIAYTLQEVTVTDDGIVAGMAYRAIKRTAGEEDEPEGYLHIVILDSRGRQLLNDVSLCRDAPWTSTPPTPRLPYVGHFLVDPDNDRLIVQTTVLSEESMTEVRWTTYRLSTGKQIATKGIEPPKKYDDRYASLIDLRPLRGTSLLLTHWLVTNKNYKVKDESGLFALLNTDYNVVWTFEVPKDYAELDSFQEVHIYSRPADYFEKHPATLATDGPGSFDLRLFADKQRVSFAVKRKPDGGYDVSETGRVPSQESGEASAPSATSKPLRYLGELEFETRSGDESPFHDIVDFTFASDGSVYLLQIPKIGWRSLVCADMNGKLLGERPYTLSGHIHWSEAGRSQGNRFLVSRSVKRVEQHGYDNSWWWVDLRTGEETREPCEEDNSIRGIGLFSDRARVVLKSVRRGGTLADVLTYFKPDQSVGWVIDNRGYREGQKLGIGPDQVIVTSDQRIVVFSMNSTWILDCNGDVIKSLPARASQTDGVSDGQGGFVVIGHESPPVILRYASDGSLRSEISVRHPDGKTFSVRQVRVAPDGRLWVNDGQSLMRLTDEGVVDLVLGRSASSQRLDRLAGFTVDRNGLLYAVAQGFGTVQVFDAAGNLLRVIEPDPADVTGTVNQAFVAVNDEGEIFVKKRATVAYMPPDDYLRFSATGERLETITFEPSLPAGEFLPAGWAFQPGTGYRCGICGMAGASRLIFVDPPSTVVREVRQRPNGRWFGFFTNIAIGPDGAIAVLNGDLSDARRDYGVDLFAANGDAIRTIELPSEDDRLSGIAFDGRRVIVAGKQELMLVNVQDERIERFSLAPNALTEGGWSLFILPKANELLMFDQRGGKLHRYRLP